MEAQNYSHVMHIVSMVEGKKKGEFHPLDLVSSFLPAGTPFWSTEDPRDGDYR